MMKEVWFEFIKVNRKYWCHGFTLKRLERVKSAVFSNEDVMWDLLHRHNASEATPEQMEIDDKLKFDHCIGNFVSNILYTMIDEQIIKVTMPL